MAAPQCSYATVEQFLREVRQTLAAVAGHDDEVLDPHARSLVRQIDPGLDGDDISGLEHIRRLGAQRGRLVDLESRLRVPSRDRRPSREPASSIRVREAASASRPWTPGATAAEPGELGIEAERVELLQPLGHVADRKRASAIRAVAVDDAPGIDEHENACLDRDVPRHRVRRCGGAAGADDRLERDALRPGLAEAPLDPPRKLFLAPTREALFRERLEDLVGESARAAHHRDLRLVLDRAERFHLSRRGLRIDAGIDERSKQRVREILLVEEDSSSREQLADRGHQAAGGFHDFEAFERACTIRVSEVRVQRGAAVGLDEDGRIGALEAREVADIRLPAEDVRRTRDEQRLFEERGEPSDPAHCLASTRYSIASRYPSGPFPMKRAATTSSMTENRRHSSRSSMLERCTSTTGTVNSSRASWIAHE